jgi:hypothetical protein
MRSMLRRPTGRARLVATSLLIALPVSVATTACAEDEPVDEGVVEEGGGVVEEGEGELGEEETE